MLRLHPDGGYAAVSGFASCDEEHYEEMITVRPDHDKAFLTLAEAREWAENQYSEYGVQTHPECQAVREFPETHRQGRLSVENAEIIDRLDFGDCDFGVQISTDGRVWVCIDGIAWLRFKPKR